MSEPSCGLLPQEPEPTFECVVMQRQTARHASMASASLRSKQVAARWLNTSLGICASHQKACHCLATPESTPRDMNTLGEGHSNTSLALAGVITSSEGKWHSFHFF